MRRKISPAFYNIPINLKFMFFYSVLALGLISFALLSNWVSSRVIVRQAQAQINREASLIRESLDSYFAEAVSYISFLSIDANLQQNLSEYNSGMVARQNYARTNISETVSKYIATRPIFSHIMIVAGDGSVVEPGGVAASVADALDLEAESDMIRPRYMSLMPVALRGGGEMLAVPLIKPVIQMESGQRMGWAVLFLPEELIASKFTTQSGYIDTVMLIDQENRVVSSLNKEDLLTVPMFDLRKPVGVELWEVNGRKSVFSIAGLPTTGWTVLTLVPVSSLTKESVGLSRMLIIFAITSFLIAWAASYAISRTISRPIRRLAETMENFKNEEDINLRVPVLGGDEIGRLSQVFNTMMGRINSLIEQNRRQQEFLRDYEFRLIQSQLNPHFLYNALEMIIMFVQMDMRDNAVSACKNLATFYRLTLSHGMDIIRIADEINLIRSYLTIQGFRYIEYMECEVRADDGIMDYEVPKLTLQPIVENAIYHGIKPRGSDGRLFVNGRLDGGDVLFTVRDNGVGMPREKIEEILSQDATKTVQKSFGIASVNTKLKLTFGAGYGITINSAEGRFTEVTIRIPLMKNGERVNPENV